MLAVFRRTLLSVELEVENCLAGIPRHEGSSPSLFVRTPLEQRSLGLCREAAACFYDSCRDHVRAWEDIGCARCQGIGAHAY